MDLPGSSGKLFFFKQILYGLNPTFLFIMIFNLLNFMKQKSKY